MESHYRTLALRTSLRLIYGWVTLGTLALTGIILITTEWRRAGEIAVPLLAGIHAALIFAPDDEPAMELLAAAPRSLMWLLVERLGLLALLQGAVGVAVMVGITLSSGEGWGLALLRWLAPALLLIGFGVYATLTMRRISNGVLAVILFYGAMIVGGDFLIARYPSLQVLHPYLSPASVPEGDYLFNRLILMLVGIGLLARAFLIVHREDKVLKLG